MKRPEAGETVHPESDAPTEEVEVHPEGVAWMLEDLGELGERITALETRKPPGRRGWEALLLRAFCALVGGVVALAAVALVLENAVYAGLTGWTLAAALACAGGVCALPALVALGLEDELVEVARLVVERRAQATPAPMAYPPQPIYPYPQGYPVAAPPPGWRGP